MQDKSHFLGGKWIAFPGFRGIIVYITLNPDNFPAGSEKIKNLGEDNPF